MSFLLPTDDLLMLSVFFFTEPASPEIYTLSLHDALPIWGTSGMLARLKTATYSELVDIQVAIVGSPATVADQDRKSTRLNSSHRCISYAVFCLKKKTKKSTPYCTLTA